jgi:hypothetical protein
VTIDGYWIDNCVYWITVYTLQFTTVHTLYNFLLFLGRPRIQLCNHCCSLLLWHPLPSLAITDSELSDHGCRLPSYIAREQTTKKTPSPILLLLYDVITERTPKKTTVSSIVALLSNGCKQAFPLLTYSVHVTIHSSFIEDTTLSIDEKVKSLKGTIPFIDHMYNWVSLAMALIREKTSIQSEIEHYTFRMIS